VEALVAAYGYVEPYRWHRVANLAHSLIETLRETASVDPLLELSGVPAQLRGASRSVVVVDCLGLAELYWIFKRVREGGLRVAVNIYVNEAGKTAFFKKVFGGETMLDVTEQLGGHLFKRVDEILHTRLEAAPRALGDLICEMEARFKPEAESIAHVAAERRVAVAADHGYDIARDGELFLLSHGGKKGGEHFVETRARFTGKVVYESKRTEVIEWRCADCSVILKSKHDKLGEKYNQIRKKGV